MKQIPSLPVELLADIVSYLTPHTPVVGHDAAWTRPSHLLNWWDGQYWKPRPTAALHSERDPSSSMDSSAEIAVSPYASLLALRQTNGQFNAICVPLLYKEFNCLEPLTTDDDVAAEVLSLYHCHIRIVRTRGWPQGNPLVEMGYKHVLPFLTQRVNTLAVYYDYREYTAHELAWFIDEIVRVLDTGHITSFGIYSNSAFAETPNIFAALGARRLLQQITVTTPLLSRLKSLDIVVQAMDEGPYDALRTQIGQLDSLTVRAAFQDDLGQVWDMNQRHKWFPCHNLTNLQLIQCSAVSALHIPYVLQFFPSLRTLTLVSCGDETSPKLPQREKGWSLRKDSLWQERAPLESLHVERIFVSEIVALGIIHTRQLTIIMVFEEGFIPFQDEELYPGLQVLRTNEVYIDSDLEEMCARRDIVLESDARALLP